MVRYLSVYVPKQCTPATPCATMQWIYGGGWELGSNREFSLYDASSFAKKNGVVVVAGNCECIILLLVGTALAVHKQLLVGASLSCVCLGWTDRLDTFGWLALAELQQESADGSYGKCLLTASIRTVCLQLHDPSLIGKLLSDWVVTDRLR